MAGFSDGRVVADFGSLDTHTSSKGFLGATTEGGGATKLVSLKIGEICFIRTLEKSELMCRESNTT